MLTGSLRSDLAGAASTGRRSAGRVQRAAEGDSFGTLRLHADAGGIDAYQGRHRQNGSAEDTDRPVDIFPVGAALRRTMAWRGMSVEVVHAIRRERTEIRYRGSRHLLIAHEQGARLEGETLLDGVPRSSLRDVKRNIFGRELLYHSNNHTFAPQYTNHYL